MTTPFGLQIPPRSPNARLSRHNIYLTLALLAAFLGGCENYPKDPRNTTEELLRGAPLRVGVINNPPWAAIQADGPSGVEVELVKGFSSTLGTKIEWVPVHTDAGFEKLKKGEIHLLIGGLLHSTPYKKDAGFTRPYLVIRKEEENLLGMQKKELHVMAVIRGENRFIILLEKFLKGQSDRLRKLET